MLGRMEHRARNLALRHPLHGEFLVLLGTVEKIKIDQLLVRKAGVVGQGFEIVQNLRTQANRRGCRAPDRVGTSSARRYKSLPMEPFFLPLYAFSPSSPNATLPP